MTDQSKKTLAIVTLVVILALPLIGAVLLFVNTSTTYDVPDSSTTIALSCGSVLSPHVAPGDATSWDDASPIPVTAALRRELSNTCDDAHHGRLGLAVALIAIGGLIWFFVGRAWWRDRKRVPTSLPTNDAPPASIDAEP